MALYGKFAFEQLYFRLVRHPTRVIGNCLATSRVYPRSLGLWARYGRLQIFRLSLPGYFFL